MSQDICHEALAIGLTLYELSENVEARSVNAKYVRVDAAPWALVGQVASILSTPSRHLLRLPVQDDADQVNEDCSGVAQAQPSPTLLLEERFVIVSDGNEIRSMTSLPAPVMVTGVYKRIDTR